MSHYRSAAAVIGVITLVLLFPLAFSINGFVAKAVDINLHYYPLKHLVTEQLTAGSMPLWDPYIFAGQPLFANPQAAVMYPLSQLFYFFPLRIAFHYYFILHFFLIGFFSFLLFRSFRLAPGASLLGCFTILLSSFLVYRVPAGHPAELAGYIWIPAMLLFLNILDNRLSFGYAFLAALVTVFQLFSGHVFPVFASVVLIILHFIFRRGGYAPNLLVIAPLVLGISAIQLLPSWELSRLTELANWDRLTAVYSMPLRHLINFLLPNYFGNGFDGSYIIKGAPSFFYERNGLYIGLIPIALAAAGLVFSLKRKKWFFGTLAALGIFLSLGLTTGLYRTLYALITPLHYIRVPARFFFLTVFAAATLAAMAFHRIAPRLRPGIRLLIVALAVADLLAWDSRFIRVTDFRSYVQKSMVSEYADPNFRIMTEPEQFNPNRALLYHFNNLNGYEAILLKDFTDYVRLQESNALSQTTFVRDDLFAPLVRGFALRTLFSSGPRKEPMAPSVPLANSLFMSSYPQPVPRLYFSKSLRVVGRVDAALRDALSSSTLAPDDEIIMENAPPGFAGDIAVGTLKSVSFGAARIAVESLLSGRGVLVLGDEFYPGWRAWAGGREIPVQRGHGVFRAIFLEPGDYSGTSRIFFYFFPGSFRYGLWISLLTIFASIFYFIRRMGRYAP